MADHKALAEETYTDFQIEGAQTVSTCACIAYSGRESLGITSLGMAVARVSQKLGDFNTNVIIKNSGRLVSSNPWKFLCGLDKT